MLIEGTDEMMYDRSGHKHARPWFCIGRGEQVGLAFCIFAALAAEDAAPPTWLGFTDVVNYLDLSHYLLTLDVLRDLVATGTSVYVKTNKEDYRRLAQSKLERAADCLGCPV
ncbi:hypothetical protein WJ96_05750 [Burkholderia ubonensis]|uniref:Uncharacterized protein n=1 Tax=Burkholderia ubonensis TaxID=101571 RepID=A0AAW3MVV3_9BURK|nr:hypothetical protein [Burkholderia ubonensis]KVP75260.1 hypothetical protein WJ93_07545 [Burkholderia ubonensis]KVP98073.1 hypothetical protein WJ96_05750 [Burkholderia ubonensis]KVZ92770.1 hypothetical protein WL25_17410 [Burkholderia ubonensis]